MDGEHFSGDGMGEGQLFGAKQLACQTKLFREGTGFGCAVLGVAQNGKAHMGAVYPQLMGAPGERLQL